MYILGIETSCDETAAAVLRVQPKTEKMEVLSNIISSQIEIHQKYGGVVPEVAAREHVLNILPVIEEALNKAGVKSAQLDFLAVTKGPGLITSLIAGLETVRALAYAWNKPVVEVNHIAGHIFANFIAPLKKIKYPAVILTVSGGHTNLVLMSENKKIKIIGETLDDAAGEAYDKAAKMLGLGYPGGPIVAKQAATYLNNPSQDKKTPTNITLPRPMLNSNNLNFSFSGLKTALLYLLKKDKNWSNKIPEYCFHYQEAIIDVLVKKTIKAAKKYQAGSVLLSGGVSANQELRQRLADAVKKEMPKSTYLVPDRAYTTDNAAMIAAAGFFQFKAGAKKTFGHLRVDPSLQLK